MRDLTSRNFPRPPILQTERQRANPGREGRPKRADLERFAAALGVTAEAQIQEVPRR
jgi:hypothetical protein